MNVTNISKVKPISDWSMIVAFIVNSRSVLHNDMATAETIYCLTACVFRLVEELFSSRKPFLQTLNL